MMRALPIMWFLLSLVAAAETGLLGYLVNTFEASGYPSPRGYNYSASHDMRVLIPFLLFIASWTTFFALCFMCFVIGSSMGTMMARIGTSVVWLLVTITLWAFPISFFHQIRIGSQCIDSPIISVCRQLEAVEAIGWTALGLCVLTLITALFSRRSYESYQSGSHRV